MVGSRFVFSLIVMCASVLYIPSFGEDAPEHSLTEEIRNDSGFYREEELTHQLIDLLHSCSEEFHELCTRLGLEAVSEERALRELSGSCDTQDGSTGDGVIEEEHDGFLELLMEKLENIAQDLNESEQLIQTLLEQQRTDVQLAYMQRELDVRERELEFKKELLAWVKEKADKESHQQKERLIRDLFLKNNIRERIY